MLFWTEDRKIIRRQAHQWQAIVRRHQWRLRLARWLRRLTSRLDP
jgi:hypothetical protein